VAELHFEARGVADDGRGEQDLVGRAEVEGQGVGVHEFAVLLAAFAAHGGLVLGVVAVVGGVLFFFLPFGFCDVVVFTLGWMFLTISRRVVLRVLLIMRPRSDIM